MNDHDARIDSSEAIGAAAGTPILDAEGQLAQVVSIRQEGAAAQAVILTEHGSRLVVALDVLITQADGTYRLPFALRSLALETGSGQTIIPIWREEIQIRKRTVDTGKGVRIHKTVTRHEQRIDEPLLQDELLVERIAVGRRVDSANPPLARQEGATLVVPVLEEMLVVEKQLWLKEEVRVTTTRHAIHHPQTVMLRSEQATVEHFDERSVTSSTRSTPPDSHPIMQD